MALGFVIAGIGGQIILEGSIQQKGPLFRASTMRDNIVTIEIGGEVVDIPNNCFVSRQTKGGDRQTFFVMFHYPTFECQNDSNVSEMSKSRNTVLTPVTPLVTDVLEVTDLEFQFGTTKRRNEPLRNEGKEYGLKKLYPDFEPLKRDSQVIYYSEDQDGKLERFINCRVNEGKPNSLCKHRFQTKNLLVRFSYGRNEHLHRWQEIEENVLKKINSFRRNP